jgi:hypothetical protein
MGSCEHGTEFSVSIQSGDFLTSAESITFPRSTLIHGAGSLPILTV